MSLAGWHWPDGESKLQRGLSRTNLACCMLARTHLKVFDSTVDGGGFVLKFYTLLSVRGLQDYIIQDLLLPDPVRKATSSLSSLTYIVSTETNQGTFSLTADWWCNAWCESAVSGCEDWLGGGTTSHWGFMIRSLENSNQDWLLLSFHRLDNNCPITGWQRSSRPDVWCCPLSSLLYWSGSVGQWGDDIPACSCCWESTDTGGWSSLYNMAGRKVPQ